MRKAYQEITIRSYDSLVRGIVALILSIAGMLVAGFSIYKSNTKGETIASFIGVVIFLMFFKVSLTMLEYKEYIVEAKEKGATKK